MFLADPYMLQKRPQPASLDPTVTAAAMIFLSPGEIVASSRALTPEKGCTIPEVSEIHLPALQAHPLVDFFSGEKVGWVGLTGHSLQPDLAQTFFFHLEDARQEVIVLMVVGPGLEEGATN